MPVQSPSAPAIARAQLLTTAQRRVLWAVAGISVFTNLLMLTGPIFMLQIYDRVLSSQSEATLVVLTALVAFLYLIFGFLDHARARIAGRLGAQLQDRLDRPLFSAALHRGQPPQTNAPNPAQDLAFVQQISAAPVFMAVFDFPWVPLFILVIAILHPLLGLVALCAALLLAGLGMLSIARSRPLVAASHAANRASDDLGQQITCEIGQIDALGMRENLLARWQALRAGALRRALAMQDDAGRFGTSAKTLRLFLQSAILASGAWLVLQAQLTPGGMIAASIILGRALAPLDQLIGNWPQLQAARTALGRIQTLNAAQPEPEPAHHRAKPSGQLAVSGVSLRIMNAQAGPQTLLRGVSFELRPGQALGVIGPTGAGKSTLAEVLAGVQLPTSGEVRLGNRPYLHFARKDLGQALGYLPQHVTLFSGTVFENIARLDPDAPADKVIAAARTAGVHELIQSLPLGYETSLGATGARLSAGQVQRIGLARALYDDPALLILDEPNAHLDDIGCRALNSAIRATKNRGGSVVIVAHRPSAISECDLLLKLDRGTVTALGPTDEILRDVTRSPAETATHAPQRAAQSFPWEWRGARAQS